MAAEEVKRIPCDSCGRLVTMERMPDDWPFDWWTHEREGKPWACPGLRPAGFTDRDK